MGKEGLVIETEVRGMSKDDEGREWIGIQWQRPAGEVKESEPGLIPPQGTPMEYVSFHVLATSLPGVKFGDRVRITLNLE